MMLAQGPFIYLVNSSMVGSVVLRTLEGEELTVLHIYLSKSVLSILLAIMLMSKHIFNTFLKDF